MGEVFRPVAAVATGGLSEVGLALFGADEPPAAPEPPPPSAIITSPPPPAPTISQPAVQKEADVQANAQLADVATPVTATAAQRQQVATGRASTILTSASDDTLGRKSNKRYALGG